MRILQAAKQKEIVELHSILQVSQPGEVQDLFLAKQTLEEEKKILRARIEEQDVKLAEYLYYDLFFLVFDFSSFFLRFFFPNLVKYV